MLTASLGETPHFLPPCPSARDAVDDDLAGEEGGGRAEEQPPPLEGGVKRGVSEHNGSDASSPRSSSSARPPAAVVPIVPKGARLAIDALYEASAVAVPGGGRGAAQAKQKLGTKHVFLASCETM
jgi:hypothetical protein